MAAARVAASSSTSSAAAATAGSVPTWASTARPSAASTSSPRRWPRRSEGTGVRVGQIRPGILITEGWLREAATAPEQVASQRRTLNVLVDHVEDVAPELVERMLASTKNGEEIVWLTTGRLARRFMTPGYARKNDKLARYGL